MLRPESLDCDILNSTLSTLSFYLLDGISWGVSVTLIPINLLLVSSSTHTFVSRLFLFLETLHVGGDSMVHKYQRNRHEAKRQNNRVQFLVSDHRCGNVFSLSSRVLVCANTCRCRFTKSTNKPPAFFKSYNLQTLQISRWCNYFKSLESGQLFYLYSVSYLLPIISCNSSIGNILVSGAHSRSP